MTLQQCKDKVAMDRGYPKWDDFLFVNQLAGYRVSELMDEAAELYRQSASEWISVKERMPEPETVVLTCVTYGGGNKEIGMSFTTKRFPDIFDSFHGDRITHWQPLPNPPKI